MKYPVDPQVFFKLGLELTLRTKAKETSTKQSFDVYTSFFGINPEQTTALWNMIDLPKGYYPIHVLWGLAFLKLYWTEIQLASVCGVMAKTLRKRVWLVLEEIAKLKSKVVSFIVYIFQLLISFSITLNTYLMTNYHR